jgi:P-type conjugative transfer protein TrbJ
MKKLIFSAALALPVYGQFLPGPCITVGPAGAEPCASEGSSLLHTLHLGVIHAQSLLEVARLTAMLADAIKNSAVQGGLPGSNLAGQLASISAVLQVGSALNQATASLTTQWDKTWTLPTPLPPYSPGAPGFHGEFMKWSSAAQDSLRVAMMAGQLSHSHMMGVASSIAQIESILAVVDGRLKAQMATASAAARTAASLEAMHNTMLSQGSAQQVYMQYSLQKDMQQHAIEQQFFAPVTVPRDNKGF